MLDSGSDAVLALRYDWRGNALVMVHNFDDQPHDAQISLEGPGRETLLSLLEGARSDAKGGVHDLVLEAYGYRWYRVRGLGCALQPGCVGSGPTA